MKKHLLFLILTLLFVGAAPRKISWVALGDSITYLNDHPDETGNRLTKGYLTQLTGHFPRVEYSNQGHNGWTAIKIAESLDKLGLVKADVYTIFLGTNDWWQGRPLGTLADYELNTGPATVHGAFRLIIDKLKQMNRKAQIILITPMQRGDFVYINNPRNNAYGSYKPKKGQTLEQVANAVLEIGKLEKIPVVDLYHKSGMNAENMVHYKRLKDPATGEYRNYTYPDYTTIPFDPDKDEYPYPEAAIAMTYDGLHPSDRGNEIIARMLASQWKGLHW
jgi:lysophospholipase L1-like esterase